MSQSLLACVLNFHNDNRTDSARPTAAEPATGSGTEPVVTAETVAAYDIRPGPSVAATDSAAAGPAEADAVSAARNESAPGAAAPRGNTPDPAAGRLFNRDDPTGWANLVCALKFLKRMCDYAKRV